MPVQSENFEFRVPRLADDRAGKIQAGKTIAFNSITEANADPKLDPSFRSIGLTVLIRDNGENLEYWYKEGTTDNDLVPKGQSDPRRKNNIDDFDVSLATDFPINPQIGGTETGDWWFITVGGTLHGMTLYAGDSIIAKLDNPSITTSNDWIRVVGARGLATTRLAGQVILAGVLEVQQTNSDIPVTIAPRVVTTATLGTKTATEARTGFSKIATQSTVNEGVDDFDYITSLKLKNRVSPNYHILQDNFNRANNSSSLGNLFYPNTTAWQIENGNVGTSPGDWGIQNNRAYTSGMTGGGAIEYWRAVAEAGVTEYTYEVDIALKVVTGFASVGGLLFRYSDWLNHNLLIIYPTEIKMFSYTGGTPTQIGSTVTISTSNNVMHTYKIIIIGNIITAYRNGAEIISATSSSNSSATKIGLMDVNGGGWGAGCLFDNLTLK
jgi:hypothetical protein